MAVRQVFGDLSNIVRIDGSAKTEIVSKYPDERLRNHYCKDDQFSNQADTSGNIKANGEIIFKEGCSETYHAEHAGSFSGMNVHHGLAENQILQADTRRNVREDLSSSNGENISRRCRGAESTQSSSGREVRSRRRKNQVSQVDTISNVKVSLSSSNGENFAMGCCSETHHTECAESHSGISSCSPNSKRISTSCCSEMFGSCMVGPSDVAPQSAENKVSQPTSADMRLCMKLERGDNDSGELRNFCCEDARPASLSPHAFQSRCGTVEIDALASTHRSQEIYGYPPHVHKTDVLSQVNDDFDPTEGVCPPNPQQVFNVSTQKIEVYTSESCCQKIPLAPTAVSENVGKETQAQLINTNSREFLCVQGEQLSKMSDDGHPEDRIGVVFEDQDLAYDNVKTSHEQSQRHLPIILKLHGRIHPQIRREVLCWFVGVCESMNFDDRVLFSTVLMVDRFCAKSNAKISIDYVRQVLLACICIVLKTSDSTWIYRELPCAGERSYKVLSDHLSRQQVPFHVILETEREVLLTLNWSVTVPTTFEFLNALVLRFGEKWSTEDLRSYTPYNLANCLLQLSLFDAEIHYNVPHVMLAASAFLLSLVIQGDYNFDVSWGWLIEHVSVLLDEDKRDIEGQMSRCVQDLWATWCELKAAKTNRGTHPYFDGLWRKFTSVRAAVLKH